MKTKVILLTAIIGVSLIFSSCKKSDNDPLLPFSTRDARITNTWKLKSLSKSETTINQLGHTDSKLFVFDGTEMSEIHTDFFGTTTEDSYTYSDSLVISKANIYTQTIEKSGDTSEMNSYWFWFDSDKNKIGIIFEAGNTYIIQRLSKDELILESAEYSEVSYENGETSSYTYNEILTYNAQ